MLPGTGRLPANEEFERASELQEHIGSVKKALRILNANADISDLEVAANERKDDLLVYFALGLFERRAKYYEMPESLQRDIKVFFGNYQQAQIEARELLFSIASPEVIEEAARSAHETLPSSIYEPSGQLLFHQKYLELLPAVLRVYIGCAAQLFGELEEIDLIKIHIRSGKVSFMGYEGFDSRPLPVLTQRIKVKLRDQDVDYFDYVGPFTPPMLYWKSRVMDASFPDYKKQATFEKKLSDLGIVESDMNFGPSEKELHAALKHQGFEIRGYRFYKVKSSMVAYFDSAASYPLLPEVAEALSSANQSMFANPSADLGEDADNAEHRRSALRTVLAAPSEIIFTRGPRNLITWRLKGTSAYPVRRRRDT